MAFTLLQLPSLHKQMMTLLGRFITPQDIVLKIRRLFALRDCCSPVIKRWSARVGDGGQSAA